MNYDYDSIYQDSSNYNIILQFYINHYDYGIYIIIRLGDFNVMCKRCNRIYKVECMINVVQTKLGFYLGLEFLNFLKTDKSNMYVMSDSLCVRGRVSRANVKLVTFHLTSQTRWKQ